MSGNLTLTQPQTSPPAACMLPLTLTGIAGADHADRRRVDDTLFGLGGDDTLTAMDGDDSWTAGPAPTT